MAIEYSLPGNLVSYTSKLTERQTGRFVNVIDFNGDEGRIRECPHCFEYGFHYILGPIVKKKGESRAPDDDQFLSGYECGNTFSIYETHFESKIKDSVETTDNPFNNETTFLSTDSRATQRRKGKKPRSKRLKMGEHEDPEIQAELDKGLAVNILYDPNK